ncbi:Leucine-rich receptor-like protein kinase family protein [Hibiscus syriacus]|uniref:Leucine-rich receptor-like protein kinase family protein n=1 Tax=Hibiscus syriacus TaxID=106335 RepID=A0A6A3C1H6_HIBSY|nr:Leucine-rich receptor-like protein kinase family protein [Hibiscus syriacus]
MERSERTSTVLTKKVSLWGYELCGLGVRGRSPRGTGKTWCVAKPSTDDAALASNINSACNYLGTRGLNCNQIQSGETCYDPETLINHASVVVNSYYQDNGGQEHACHFTNSGLITVSDPSYGSCQYA